MAIATNVMLKLKPKNDFILIKRIEETQSELIVTPDRYKQTGDKAVVIAVGDNRIVGNLLIPIDDIQPAQIVAVSRVGGTNLPLNGEELELIRYGDILGIIEEDENAN